MTFDFEPFKPIQTSLYLCDNRFHTEPLQELLQSNTAFGFIVMDGNGALFGRVTGNHKEILQKIAVDLPKKHGRGGQSALRFARLRLEKRHNYLRKVAELATQHFITNDVPNVTGLVLAGLSLFKKDLSKSDLFDGRLQRIVVAIVDVAYGGENGFSQAIELSSEALGNVRFVAEKKLIGKFFEEIDRDTGKYCFGVRDTLQGLEQGVIQTLILWEDLEIDRITVQNSETGEESLLYLTKEEQKKGDYLTDKNGTELEVKNSDSLTDFLAEHYRDFGCNLEFVTDKSEEGAQFCRGFGGIGGLLRYKVEFYQEEDFYSSDDDSSFM